MNIEKIQSLVLTKKIDSLYWEICNDTVFLSLNGHVIYMFPKNNLYLNLENITKSNLVNKVRELSMSPYRRILEEFSPDNQEYKQFHPTNDIRILVEVSGKKVIKYESEDSGYKFFTKNYLDLFGKNIRVYSIPNNKQGTAVVYSQAYEKPIGIINPLRMRGINGWDWIWV